MKTITKHDEILRVKDSKVDAMLKEGWQYCPKHIWKTKVRDINKRQTVSEMITEIAVPESKQLEKKSKKQNKK